MPNWHLARVGIDYHVVVQGFFYSVPHALIREQVDSRATARTIEVFHRGKRIAAHPRRYGCQSALKSGFSRKFRAVWGCTFS
jgi:hypothetical protein